MNLKEAVAKIVKEALAEGKFPRKTGEIEGKTPSEKRKEKLDKDKKAAKKGMPAPGKQKPAFVKESDEDESESGRVDARNMSEGEFQDILREAVESQLVDHNVRVRAYSDSGLMTRNAGLIVRVGDNEFQVTIAKVK